MFGSRKRGRSQKKTGIATAHIEPERTQYKLKRPGRFKWRKVAAELPKCSYNMLMCFGTEEEFVKIIPMFGLNSTILVWEIDSINSK